MTATPSASLPGMTKRTYLYGLGLLILLGLVLVWMVLANVVPSWTGWILFSVVLAWVGQYEWSKRRPPGTRRQT